MGEVANMETPKVLKFQQRVKDAFTSNKDKLDKPWAKEALTRITASLLSKEEQSVETVLFASEAVQKVGADINNSKWTCLPQLTTFVNFKSNLVTAYSRLIKIDEEAKKKKVLTEFAKLPVTAQVTKLKLEVADYSKWIHEGNNQRRMGGTEYKEQQQLIHAIQNLTTAVPVGLMWADLVGILSAVVTLTDIFTPVNIDSTGD